MKNSSINIFSKLPVVGKVKTRLGVDIGVEKALKIHCDLLMLTLNEASKCECDLNLYLDKVDFNNTFCARCYPCITLKVSYSSVLEIWGKSYSIVLKSNQKSIINM